MWRRSSLAILVCLLFLLLALPSAGDQAVHLDFYMSPECESCHYVLEQIIPPLQEIYGAQLDVTLIDMTTPEGLTKLEAEEARLGRPNNPLPVIIAGDTIIANDDLLALEDTLIDFLQERLSGGESPTVVATEAVDATPEADSPTSQNTSPIHIAYIEKDGCEHCARAHVVLSTLQLEFPSMIVATFDSMHDTDIVEAMGQYLALPDERRLIAPSVYLGTDTLINDEITSNNLRPLLVRYAQQGAPAFWEHLDIAAGKSSIIERFHSMGPLAVVLAGLIDGVNPCAFATIIFFVSYLAISRRGKGALIAIGLAFTAGVFVTYLLVGLGAMWLLQWANTIRIVGLVLYGAMGLGCLVLAGISIHDYQLARQGRLHDMKLNLPAQLRERIKGRIRSGSGAFVGAAFVSGLAVSLLELACTGQVYLPTISFVVGIPAMRSSAIAYLVLYNLVFVVPLLIILFLAVYGISAARFQDWFVGNAAKTKLVMAVLFVVLGLLLLSQVFAF